MIPIFEQRLRNGYNWAPILFGSIQTFQNRGKKQNLFKEKRKIYFCRNMFKIISPFTEDPK